MKKRIASCALALLLALGCALPAGAYQVPASYDETYYATLDYYGAVTEASVVKSYLLNGQTSVTDYGDYDQVVNLTDGSDPVRSGDKLVFTPADGREKFYFEGKTQKPFDELPWTVAVSYKLNGAPAQAETLAGQTGLVEILVDVLPNPKAPEYTRTNLVLTVATAFNDDDITSLEAPGAEVQLLGNLRTVLFAVLPGQEQHFAIRVGSQSFESAGLVLLAVPATLQQVEQVADLRQAKEDAQDSLDAMDASLDVILDTLEGMSGSLNTAASGLDQLNAARGTVSARKDDIYAAADGLDDLEAARAQLSAGRETVSQSADAALESLTALSAALAALDPYSAVATQAVDDLNAALNGLNDATQDLTLHLASARSLVVKLQKDTKNLSELLSDAEGYNKRAKEISADLAAILDDADISTAELRRDLDELERSLRLVKGLSPITTADLLALLSPEEQAQMKEVLSLHEQYESYLSANGLTQDALSFQDFIVAGAYRQFCQATVTQAVEANAPAAVAQAVEQFAQANGRAPDEAELAAIQAQVVQTITEAATAQLPTLEQFVRADAAQVYVQKAQAAAQAYDQFSAKLPLVEAANKKLQEVNALVTGLTTPTAKVIDQLSRLCGTATSTGVTGDLLDTAELCRDLFKTLQEHQGEGQELLDHLDELGDLTTRLTNTADDLLVQTDRLTGLVNTYTPDLQNAITDVSALSAALQTTLDQTAAALTAAKDALHAAGDGLDSGTEKTLGGLSSAVNAVRAADSALDNGTRSTLSGVSAALRQSTAGLGQTGVIRDAKDTIRDLFDDQWDAHSGEIDTLLLMDAEATPVSMTSSKNPAPRSVQYILRTQEIKVSDPADDAPAQTKQANTRSVWQRIVDMFADLWNGFLSLFTGKG